MSNDTTKMLLGIDDEHLIIEEGQVGDDGVIRLVGSLNYPPRHAAIVGLSMITKLLAMVGGRPPLDSQKHWAAPLSCVSIGETFTVRLVIPISWRRRMRCRNTARFQIRPANNA